MFFLDSADAEFCLAIITTRSLGVDIATLFVTLVIYQPKAFSVSHMKVSVVLAKSWIFMIKAGSHIFTLIYRLLSNDVIAVIVTQPVMADCS